MTIRSAINQVLQDQSEGLTPEKIHQLIVENDLYHFGAKDPVSVVSIEIRRHCEGIDFPTASNHKFFRIVKTVNKRNYYGILTKPGQSDPQKKVESHSHEMLPEERIMSAFDEHVKMMKNQLIEMILANKSDFFEKMVVDLLLKMGYGYDKDSGIVTGRPHDGGIDGIIKEDKFGLDSIYIQAKRYDLKNTVKAPQIQQFIGAMGKVNKGVFITTSSFTTGAIKNAKDSPYKTIQLIDGDQLAELMLAYGAGVTAKRTVMLYQIDEDYFN